MTDQACFMPTRLGSVPGSAEFEAVARQFGVKIKTLAKTDEESLKGLSKKTKENIHDDVSPGKFTKECETLDAAGSFVNEMHLNEERKLIKGEETCQYQSSGSTTKGILPQASGSFKDSNIQTKLRRFSSPGRLSKHFQGLSLTEDELLQCGKSKVKRKSVGQRNNTTNSFSKAGNVDGKKVKFGEQVGLSTKKGYRLSLYNAEDTTKARQEMDSLSHEDRLRKSSNSEKPELSNNSTLLNSVTVNSAVVPMKGRNITRSLVSDVFFPEMNGGSKSHELSRKVARKGLSRRMSFPVISQSTLSKSSLSLHSRKNSGPEQFSDYMNVDSVRDSLLSRRNSRLEISTSRSQINEVNSEKCSLSDSRNYADSGKNRRSRKLSLPASFYHSVEERSVASKTLDDFGRKSSVNELIKLDDELPQNLGNNVNPEHIFRLWNVKLPKHLANELKIELTQNVKKR